MKEAQQTPRFPGPHQISPGPPRSGLRYRALAIFWLAFCVSSSYFLYSFCAIFLSQRFRKAWKTSLHRKNALRLQTTTLALKGLLIKLGQFMSARVDILPEAYIEALSLLQDQVPPAPFSEIRARLIEELGGPPEEIFDDFHEVPIASASLGQVHEAFLKRKAEVSDRPARVAVKVQYPGIEDIVQCDLRAIQAVVEVLQVFFKHIRFDVLFKEFSRIVQQEMNYLMEGRQAEQFKKNFEDDARIVVPGVFWAWSTRRVLTLEYVDGIKINALSEIASAGIKPSEVATLLAESYMKQILQHRFFHGDPHPGNLFVQPGPRLVFVDFGLMQPVDGEMHRGMKQMMMAIIDRDIPAIAKALLALGFIARSEHASDIEKVVHFFMDRYRDLPPRAYKEITVTQIAEDLQTLFKIYPALQIPNHFILVGRTVGMLNGLCYQLAPNLNIIELATPHAKRFAAEAEGLHEWLSRGKEIASALIDLPLALRDFLAYANSGQFRTHMVAEELTHVLSKLYRLAYRTILAAVIASASFLFVLPGRELKAVESGLLSAAILIPSIALLYSFIRWRSI